MRASNRDEEAEFYEALGEFDAPYRTIMRSIALHNIRKRVALETRSADIVQMIRIRHGRLPAGAEQRINSIIDGRQLRALFTRVLRAKTITEVKAALLHY